MRRVAGRRARRVARCGVLLLAWLCAAPGGVGAQVVDHPVVLRNYHMALEAGAAGFGEASDGWYHVSGWGLAEPIPHLVFQGSASFDAGNGMGLRLLDASIAYVSGRPFLAKYRVEVERDVVASSTVVTHEGVYEANQYEITEATIHGLRRRGMGLRAGLLYRVVLWEELGVFSSWSAYGGLLWVLEEAYDGSVQGYGRYSHGRYTYGGFEAVYDLSPAGAGIPTDSEPNPWGLRGWLVQGGALGLVGWQSRLELGFLPSGTGFYLYAAIGVGLHVDRGGTAYEGS